MVSSLAVEMAITDWAGVEEDIKGEYRSRLEPTIILSNAILGFFDNFFWRAYNLFEPEKSIESVIKKFRKD